MKHSILFLLLLHLRMFCQKRILESDGVGLHVVLHELKSGWWTVASEETGSKNNKTEVCLSVSSGA